MSAVMRSGVGPAPMAPVPATAAGPVTQVRVVRAEWTKLRALRSTWWCGLLAVVLIVGLGAAIAGSGAPYTITAANSAAGGVSVSLVGIVIAQLVLGVLGVLAFSGEYATGMIRATLAVVPSRLPVLWAKLIVVVGLVLPLSLLAALAEFFVATALESSRGGSAISLTDLGVLREVVGASLSPARTARRSPRRRCRSPRPRPGRFPLPRPQARWCRARRQSRNRPCARTARPGQRPGRLAAR
jgi:ABC-2 type transport system permease protein